MLFQEKIWHILTDEGIKLSMTRDGLILCVFQCDSMYIHQNYLTSV